MVDLDLGPFNECVYCRSTNGPFTDEHIIPLALNGSIKLRAASCQACQVVTSKFEGVLRQSYSVDRAVANIKSRRAKTRPTSWELRSTKAGSRRPPNKVVPEMRPLAEYPLEGPWVWPNFDGPGIVLGIDPLLGNLGGAQGGVPVEAADYLSSLKPGRDVIIKARVDRLAFARMIAKIAHCFAVSVVGVDGFAPYLRPLIIKGSTNATHFLGTEERKSIDGSACSIRLKEERAPTGQSMMIARVKVFGYAASPTYIVAVGERVKGVGWLSECALRTDR